MRCSPPWRPGHRGGTAAGCGSRARAKGGPCPPTRSAGPRAGRGSRPGRWRETATRRAGDRRRRPPPPERPSRSPRSVGRSQEPPTNRWVRRWVQERASGPPDQRRCRLPERGSAGGLHRRARWVWPVRPLRSEGPCARAWTRVRLCRCGRRGALIRGPRCTPRGAARARRGSPPQGRPPRGRQSGWRRFREEHRP